MLDVATNAGASRESVYLRLTRRDLARIIELVVPAGRDGVLNGPSASQILGAWRTKRLFGPEVIGPLETLIAARTSGSSSGANDAAGGGTTAERFSRSDILRRIEDDRERVRFAPAPLPSRLIERQHKRLRERLWILPIPQAPDPPFRLAIALPLTQPGGTSTDPSPHTPLSPPGLRAAPTASRTAALCIDLEVEQLYERLGPLDGHDLGAIRQSQPYAPSLESR